MHLQLAGLWKTFNMSYTIIVGKDIPLFPYSDPGKYSLADLMRLIGWEPSVILPLIIRPVAARTRSV